MVQTIRRGGPEGEIDVDSGAGTVVTEVSRGWRRTPELEGRDKQRWGMGLVGARVGERAGWQPGAVWVALSRTGPPQPGRMHSHANMCCR